MSLITTIHIHIHTNGKSDPVIDRIENSKNEIMGKLQELETEIEKLTVANQEQTDAIALEREQVNAKLETLQTSINELQAIIDAGGNGVGTVDEAEALIVTVKGQIEKIKQQTADIKSIIPDAPEGTEDQPKVEG